MGDRMLDQARARLHLTPVLARASEAAAVALARHDERLARIGRELAEGALRRADIAEAQALVGLRGGVAALEDIVLNDAGMDARAPTSDVARAVSLLSLRRSLARRGPDEAFETVLADLVGGADPPLAADTRPPWPSPSLMDDDEDLDSDSDSDLAFDEPEPLDDLDPFDDAPEPPVQRGAASLEAALAEAKVLLARTRRPLASFNDLDPAAGPRVVRVSDPDYGGERRLAIWREAIAATEALPAAAAAAVALDRWLLLEPSEHRGEAGFLLAADLLRRRGLARLHLAAAARGYRRGKFRWSPHQGEGVRIEGLLAALEDSARLGGGDLDRLSLAQELLARRASNRSKNSRLPALASLFVASPLVTVQMAAAALHVTPQAVEAMLKELGPSLPRELTGRRRYRAWGIV